MRVGERVQSVKFMLKLREEHTEEALDVLRDSVVPVLKRLLESAPSDDPGYADDLRRLHRDVVGGVHSATHAMSHHHKKRRRPAEYEALRRELYAEENRLRVAGCQLDCYARYDSEADLKADSLDPEGKQMHVPHSARFLTDALDGLLFLRLEGFYQTVVRRTLPGPPPVGEGLHAAQALVPVLPRGGRNAGGWLRRLFDDLASGPGFAGALALGSIPVGFSGGSYWTPRGIRQYRGDEPDPDEGGARGLPVPHQTYFAHELLTMWLTGADAWAGAALLARLASDPLGGAIPEEGTGTGAGRRVLSGLGELALRAYSGLRNE